MGSPGLLCNFILIVGQFQRYLSFFKVPEGVQHFSRGGGGVQLFPGGGGGPIAYSL